MEVKGVKRRLSLTRDEQEMAEDTLFLLADEAAAQRRHSGCIDDIPSRMTQICDDAARAQRSRTVCARCGALALLVCRALEAMLRESEPGGAVLAALRAGRIERSEGL